MADGRTTGAGGSDGKAAARIETRLVKTRLRLGRPRLRRRCAIVAEAGTN